MSIFRAFRQIGDAIGDGFRGIKRSVGNLADDMSGATDAREASKQQQQGIIDATGSINKYYDQARAQQQPLYEQGMRDYSTLGDMIRSGQLDYKPQQYQDAQQQPGFSFAEQQPQQYQDKGFTFNASEDPGAAYRMQQGTEATNTSAAAKGGGLSGATLKSLARYGQNLGSQEYGNAYSRYQDRRNFGAQQYAQNLGQYNTNRNFAADMYGTNLNQFNTNRNFGANQNQLYNQQMQDVYNNKYNMYSQLANTGLNTGANLANMTMSQGDQLANLAIQRGNTNASGIVAPGNLSRQFTGNTLGMIGKAASVIAPMFGPAGAVVGGVAGAMSANK